MDGWSGSTPQGKVEDLKNQPERVFFTAQIDVTNEKADEALSQLADQDRRWPDLYSCSRNLEPEKEMKTMQTNGLGFVRMVSEAHYLAKHGGDTLSASLPWQAIKGIGPFRL